MQIEYNGTKHTVKYLCMKPMVKTTKAQRKAIKKCWLTHSGIMSYRLYRELAVSATIGCDGAIALQWKGMVLCIERDGYTHS